MARSIKSGRTKHSNNFGVYITFTVNVEKESGVRHTGKSESFGMNTKYKTSDCTVRYLVYTVIPLNWLEFGNEAKHQCRMKEFCGKIVFFDFM